MSAVLYDVPGPRARVRNLGFGAAGTLVVLGVLGYAVYRFAAAGLFDAAKWEWVEFSAIQRLMADALLKTLSAFGAAAVLSLLFGAIFAAGRLSEHRWLRAPSAAVVEFFRAVPLLVLIFILFFGVSRTFGVNISTFWAVVLGLMLYNGSVFAEIFRAGVNSLPKGQSEAAYALGLRKTQVMTQVLLPQALRAMLPTIISQLVVVMKDTALGFIVQYEELLFVARLIGNQGQLGSPILQVAIVVALIYIGLCVLLSLLANYLERRTRRRGPPIRVDPAGLPRAQVEGTPSVLPAGGAAA